MSGNREKYVKRKSSRQNSHKDHVMVHVRMIQNIIAYFRNLGNLKKVKINRHWFWECFFQTQPVAGLFWDFISFW